MTRPDWIGVDWGLTHLRAYAKMDDGTCAGDLSSPNGIQALGHDGFEDALLSLIAPWLDEEKTVPVIACGMIGARDGWVDAGYHSVPARLPAPGLAPAPSRDPRISVFAIPGLSQSAPPDVMRGEETQIAGLLAGAPQFDGVVCLPGTHSKWARVSAEEVVSFSTYMTGELFGLLCRNSSLSPMLSESQLCEASFLEALSEGIARPQALAGRLFAIRATQILQGATTDKARGTLSGLLIGAELAAARPYWLGQEIALIGSETLTGLYGLALEAQGVLPKILGGSEMSQAGLNAMRNVVM